MDAEYGAILTLLKQNGLQHHSFSNEKLANARLVIRGLDAQSNPDAVLDELRKLEFPIKEAIRLHTILAPREELLPKEWVGM